jgi:hypothetical protein
MHCLYGSLEEPGLVFMNGGLIKALFAIIIAVPATLPQEGKIKMTGFGWCGKKFHKRIEFCSLPK